MLVICHSIQKRELDSLKDALSLEKLTDYVKRVHGGLGDRLQGFDDKPYRLRKIQFTSQRGHGRLVLAIFLKHEGSYFPVMVRLKNDKAIGTNMSRGNTRFMKALGMNIDLIEKDLREGNYDKYPI